MQGACGFAGDARQSTQACHLCTGKKEGFPLDVLTQDDSVHSVAPRVREKIVLGNLNCTNSKSKA